MKRVKFEDNYIEISGVAPNPDFSYDIWIERIKTDQQMEWWLEHLRNKNWWDKELESNFISTVNEANGRTANKT